MSDVSPEHQTFGGLLPFAGTVQTDIVRQYLQSGHLLVACHIMLRSAGTVAEARRLCRELMDWTEHWLEHIYCRN